MKTRITVTQEHINHGLRCWPNYCPIALAVKEQLETDAWVNFHITLAGRAVGKWWDGTVARDWGEEYRISATMKQFIDDFDAGLVVEPFSFEMEPLSPEELKFERELIRERVRAGLHAGDEG